MKAQSQMKMISEALKSYSPNRKKFDSYIEWRRANETGTYVDYKKWRAAA